MSFRINAAILPDSFAEVPEPIRHLHSLLAARITPEPEHWVRALCARSGMPPIRDLGVQWNLSSEDTAYLTSFLRHIDKYGVVAIEMLLKGLAREVRQRKTTACSWVVRFFDTDRTERSKAQEEFIAYLSKLWGIREGYLDEAWIFCPVNESLFREALLKGFRTTSVRQAQRLCWLHLTRELEDNEFLLKLVRAYSSKMMGHHSGASPTLDGIRAEYETLLYAQLEKLKR